jgi:hypothetical protein
MSHCFSARKVWLERNNSLRRHPDNVFCATLISKEKQGVSSWIENDVSDPRLLSRGQGESQGSARLNEIRRSAMFVPMNDVKRLKHVCRK